MLGAGGEQGCVQALCRWVQPSSEMHPWRAGSSSALGSSSLPGYQTLMSHSHTESNKVLPPNPI